MLLSRRAFTFGCALWTALLMLMPAPRAAQQQAAPAAPRVHTDGVFQTANECFACHNGLTTPLGEDVSIGASWRASMMANSARDPYWHAAVRREVLDHPDAQAEIEDVCSTCHMPMARFDAVTRGGRGEVLANLSAAAPAHRLAFDGVSCTVCHQIKADNLGKHESFDGGFEIDRGTALGSRPIYGPHAVDAGRESVMRSATQFSQAESAHVRESELCATCHTLYTTALDERGEVIGELPEQVPYQEWLHSDYKDAQSCQACHMPKVDEEFRVTSVLGKYREEMSRHVFVGGNFFMQRLLNRFRGELSVVALPEELEAAAAQTVDHLQKKTVELEIASTVERAGRVEAEVAIRNLSGHKFPTAYPSRRAWLHVVVRDRNGRTVFESGALDASGLIHGNDNDADPLRYEPHYSEITKPDEVEIYEAIMVDRDSKPTTGLLSAVRYEKDNRLLPKGFDKSTAGPDIAVHGSAAEDPNFTGGEDRIRYSVDAGQAQGPFQMEAELWFQPISYRWASNLKPYNAMEPQRFTKYYEQMASGSAVKLAAASATAPAR
jgi:hypothetical protein